MGVKQGMNLEDTQEFTEDSKTFLESEGQKAFADKLMAKWQTENELKKHVEAFTVRFEPFEIKRMDYVCHQLGISRQKFIHDIVVEMLGYV